jgi:alanine dehydrogenase
MDGDVVTAARTAACSALSVRLLARPESSVLAVLGTGPQARAHALYAAPMRPFEEIRLGGRNPAKVAALADDLAAEGLPVRGCGLDEAIAAADVVCAATSATEPLLRQENVRPGTHIASVGYQPNGGEVEADLLLGSLIVVEHRATALQPFPAWSRAAVRGGATTSKSRSTSRWASPFRTRRPPWCCRPRPGPARASRSRCRRRGIPTNGTFGCSYGLSSGELEVVRGE